MEQSGVRPSSVTWTTMVVGFARSNSFQVTRTLALPQPAQCAVLEPMTFHQCPA